MIDKQKKKEHFSKAAGHFQKAHQLEPMNYEYAAYALTALANVERTKEAFKIGNHLTENFKKAPRFSFESDPWYLYASVVGMSDPDKMQDIIRERSKSPDASALVHFAVVKQEMKRADSPREKVRLLGEFIRRMEDGDITNTGYDIHSLVSAYYKLGHELFKMDMPEMALLAYRKLSSLSPHYAEIHYNNGIIYSSLAKEESHPAKKEALLEKAKREFELQKKYDWHGRATQSAQKQLDRMGE